MKIDRLFRYILNIFVFLEYFLLFCCFALYFKIAYCNSLQIGLNWLFILNWVTS